MPFFHPASDNADPYWDYLVLWLDGTSFTDSSQYNTTIDQNGASISGGGYLGDGNSLFFTTDNAANFVLGAGSFTIQFELYRQTDTWGTIVGKTDAISYYWFIGMGVSGPLKFHYNSIGTMTCTTPSTDYWASCVFTYDGTTLKYYLDGSLSESATVDIYTDSEANLGIMAENTSTGAPYLGYFSGDAFLRNLKIYKGVAIAP